MSSRDFERRGYDLPWRAPLDQDLGARRRHRQLRDDRDDDPDDSLPFDREHGLDRAGYWGEERGRSRVGFSGGEPWYLRSGGREGYSAGESTLGRSSGFARERREEYWEHEPGRRPARHDAFDREAHRREFFGRAASAGDPRGPAARGGHSGRGPRHYRRSDERIQDDVCARLAGNIEVDASDVVVRVENGEVTLAGSVADRDQKRLAEDLADAVLGVTHVGNELRVHRGAATGTPSSSPRGL